MRFPSIRPYDFTINAAITEKSEYVTFYEFPESTVSSTVNSELAKDYLNNRIKK